MDMHNTYWNSNGKYQQDYDKLSKLMPDFEYTNNMFMNLLINISKIYYGIYNNGNSFLDYDNTMQFLEHFENEIDFEYYKDYCEEDLENLVNRIIEFLKDKDLSYTEHIIYINHKENKLSKENKDGFKKVTSGSAKYLNDWIESFVNCYKYQMI